MVLEIHWFNQDHYNHEYCGSLFFHDEYMIHEKCTKNNGMGALCQGQYFKSLSVLKILFSASTHKIQCSTSVYLKDIIYSDKMKYILKIYSDKMKYFESVFYCYVHKLAYQNTTFTHNNWNIETVFQ